MLLHGKIKAYKLQEEGLDTVEANLKLGYPMDLRDYGMGAQILGDLGVRKIRLMTNNPRKVVALEGHQLTIVEQVPIRSVPNAENARYLETKKKKMGAHAVGCLQASELPFSKVLVIRRQPAGSWTAGAAVAQRRPPQAIPALFPAPHPVAALAPNNGTFLRSDTRCPER